MTSNFHSRRTAEVFCLYLPEFDFLAEGSVDPAFHPQVWWTKPDDRHLLLSEYQKMIGTFFTEIPPGECRDGCDRGPGSNVPQPVFL